ncbi:MAG: hypothetical protein AB1758_29700, partial [Candidatus Eremiobacterota bacterium]
RPGVLFDLFRRASKEQQCLVYPRADEIVVVCRMQAGPGVYYSCDPVTRLDARARPAEMGQAVLKALRATRVLKGNTASSLSLPFVPSDSERVLTVESDGREVRVEGRNIPAQPDEVGRLVLQLASLPPPQPAVPVGPDPPRGFGYKTAWMAARCAPERMLEALGLRQVTPSSWEAGLASEGIFVTPEIDRWTMAVGVACPDPGTESYADPVLLLLEGLSQRLGPCAYFASDRVSGLAAWARAEDGTIVRAYACLGEVGATLWKLGAATSEERIERFFDETCEAAEQPGYWERTDLTWPDEEDVLTMARAWSLDPTTLGDRGLPPSTGWVGRLPK